MKKLSDIMLTCLTIFCLSTSLFADYPPRYEGETKYRQYESNPLDLVSNYIPGNPVIFEAGAHYGTDTTEFVKKWPEATIYSFEPNPHAYGLLVENTKKFPNVHPQGIAITDFNGTITLNVCYGTNGDDLNSEVASSVLEANDYMKQHYQGPKVEVACTILGDWCKTNNVSGFDFMWIDMEGYEMQALSASLEILSKAKVIYIETNFQELRKGMTQYRDLKPFLEANGFKMIAHWYLEGLQGNAIFVKESLLSNSPEKQ